MMNPHRAEARWLLTEHAKLGGSVTYEALAGLAERELAGSRPYNEREALVSLALEMHVEQSGGQQGQPELAKEPRVEKLTRERVKEHTRAFLRKNPGATAGECYDYVCTKGVPSMKKTSFGTMVMPHVRRELGIDWPAGGKRRRASRTRKTHAREAVAEAPDSVPDLPQATPSEPASSNEHESKNDSISIQAPGGSLEAFEMKPGWWHVDYKGPVPLDLLAPLVSELVRPIGEERVA